MQQHQCGYQPVVLLTDLSADERAARRNEMCAWCWGKRHPDRLFPEEWSSTICPDCQAEEVAKLALIKAARAATQAQKGETHL